MTQRKRSPSKVLLKIPQQIRNYRNEKSLQRLQRGRCAARNQAAAADYAPQTV
jgi:hypothetical protein